MDKREQHYGSVPPHRRRLFAAACAAIGGIVVAAGLVVNWATGTSIHWGWLMVAVGFAVGVYAFYLWIRLSD